MPEPKSISDIIEAGIKEIANVDPVRLSLTPEEIRQRAEASEAEKAERLKRQEAISRSARESREKEWATMVPPVFMVTLDDLPEDLRLECGEWLARSVRGTIILAGPTGVGKSYCGYALAHAMFLEGLTPVIHEVPTFLNQLFGPGSVDLLEEAKNADVLFLDEMKFHAKEDDKDATWAAEKLLMIIDHRWKWQKPMIVTTNIHPKKFPAMFGDRITSRLLYKVNQPGGTLLRTVRDVDRRIIG